MIPRNKYIYSICFLFLFVQNCFAQLTDEINVSGNKVFSNEEVIRWSGLRKGLQYNSAIIDSALTQLSLNLARLGYYHPELKLENLVYNVDSSNVDVFLHVNEGGPTIVKDIIIEGVDSLTEQNISADLNYLKDQVLLKDDLENQINSILIEFENIGFPFINVVIRSIDIYKSEETEGYNADIYLEVKSGIKSRIDKVEVRGNTSTKDDVIIRELRLVPGELYSQSLIEEFPRRLNRLRFFEPVGTPQFYMNSQNEGILLINVKERQTNNFDGIIGYIPPAANEDKGYLTGLVNISLRNLFGTGRAAAFRWQQFDRNSQDLEMKYLEPWLFGFPFNINLSLFQRKQDTTYVQRKVEGAVEYLATEDISASVFLSTESVIPTITEVPRFTVYNSTILTSGISFRIDTRDDPFAPTGGLLFNTSYSFSQKKINGPAEFITPSLTTEFNFQRVSLSLNMFYELFTRQVIALGLTAKELRGSEFENSDLFRLGGTLSLRGYREEQFLGNRVFWSNLEFRSLLTRRSYGFIFFDTGYYLRNAEPERQILKSEDFKIGYGLGLSLETGLGVLAVSFALGEGDSFGDGKIHFGIVNEF